MSVRQRSVRRHLVLAAGISFGCVLLTALAWLLYATAPAGPVRPL